MRFEKVSFEQYLKDYKSINEGKLLPTDDEIRADYDAIQLPCRATSGSAGYDFFAPRTLDILGVHKDIPAEGKRVPTGIRVLLDDDKFLAIYPRSGLGFKHRVALYNTVGIIDSDYYYSDNEGHIIIKLTAQTDVTVEKGKAFAQGIIQQYFTVDDDNASGVRNGGMGSTT